MIVVDRRDQRKVRMEIKKVVIVLVAFVNEIVTFGVELAAGPKRKCARCD